MKWEANELLTDVVAGRRPGTALDIGMGQGRNALFLAESGWKVTGFDISDEAVEQALVAAAGAALELDAQLGDVNEFDYGHERWDLVIAMYMHGLILPRVDEIVDSIAPGGLLVIEGFHRDLNFESVQGGYFGYRTNELPRAFDELRVLNYEDRSGAADWGRSTSGEKPIVRFVARKPLETVPDLRGAYLGQEPPGLTPVLFAPGLVNTDAIELNGVVAPGGREFLFTRRIGEVFTLHHSVMEDGEWSVPPPLLLYPGRENAMAVDMACSVDGQRLYWLGRHESELFPGEPGLDLWVSNRIKGDWSTASILPLPITTEAMESYPCVVADGSLYFSSDRPGSLGGADIYRAQRLADGNFAEPVNLGSPINSEHSEGDTYVAPDESYLILTSGRPGGLGSGDLYISFRAADGSWGEPVSLGETINSEYTDFCPMVTPDGEYFFFSRRVVEPGTGWDGVRECSVYWVSAKVLEELRR